MQKEEAKNNAVQQLMHSKHKKRAQQGPQGEGAALRICIYIYTYIHIRIYKSDYTPQVK